MKLTARQQLVMTITLGALAGFGIYVMGWIVISAAAALAGATEPSFWNWPVARLAITMGMVLAPINFERWRELL